MNSYNCIGRVATELELKQTNNGKSVTNFSIAVQSFRKDSEGKAIADFFPVVCWEKVAEFVTKYCSKGMRIGVSGSLQTRKWTDDFGNKHSIVEILANNIEFADGKKEDGEDTRQSKSENKNNHTKQDSAYKNDDDDEDDLPF